MTFDELVEEVFDLTNRPDLVAETESAVRAATIKAHQSDFFSKDIFETGIEFDVKSFRQSLDIISFVTNFRALKYLRRVDPSQDTTDGIDATSATGAFFDIITIEETLDSYGVNRTDIAYIAGRTIEIRASVAFDKALLGGYALPVVTPVDKYSSWIAEMHPFAIIREAARVIFKTIGFDEQSAAYNALVVEEYILLKMTGLSDVGY